MAKANKKYFRSETVPHLVTRFEDMMKNNTQYYFDINEFVDLIDFYIDDANTYKATSAVNIASLQHPNSTTIQLRNGQLHLDNGNIKKALTIAIHLEKIEPSEPEIYILQANCFIELNRIAQAENSIEKALQHNNSELDEAYHDIGYLYLDAEKYEMAKKYIKKAAQINKKNFAAIFDYAYTNFLTEDYEESIVWYQKYLTKYPLSDQAWNNIGTVYATLKKTELAVEAFNFAISANRNLESAYLGKAELMFSLGRYEEAIESYTQLLENNTSNNSLYFLIADCYQNLNDYSSALKFYKKSLEQNAYFADSWFSIASILFSLGKYYEAGKFVEKAIEIDSSEIEFWHLAARIYSEIGTFQKASCYYQNAIEIDPTYKNVWISYSEYCFQNGFIEKSIDILEIGVYNNPDTSDFHYLLSLFYLEDKNPNLAKYHFQVAINLDFKFHKLFFKHYPQAKNFKKFQEIISAKQKL